MHERKRGLFGQKGVITVENKIKSIPFEPKIKGWKQLKGKTFLIDYWITVIIDENIKVVELPASYCKIPFPP